MQVSLRARLTAWYSVLAVLTLAVFAAAVLWLHWRLLIEQFDDGLESIAATADNVVAEELEELRKLPLAVEDMAAVVRSEDGVVQVLDAAGTPIGVVGRQMPLPSGLGPDGARRPAAETLVAQDGQLWRVLVRRGRAHGYQYYRDCRHSADRGGAAVADAAEGLPGRAAARPALCRRGRLVARLARAAADAADGGRSARDYRQDTGQPVNGEAFDHRERSARRLVQPCARSVGQCVVDSAAVHGRRLARTPDPVVDRPHRCPGDPEPAPPR